MLISFAKPLRPDLFPVSKQYDLSKPVGAQEIKKDSTKNANMAKSWAFKSMEYPKSCEGLLAAIKEQGNDGWLMMLHHQLENAEDPVRRLGKYFDTEKPTDFFLLDVDDDSFESLEAYLECVCQYVPELKDVSYVVQHSNSSRLNGNKDKYHIYFLLENALSTAELKHIFRKAVKADLKSGRNIKLNEKTGKPIGLIDTSLFDAVHVNYITAPVIINGEDPIKERVFVVKGKKDTVSFGADNFTDYNEYTDTFSEKVAVVDSELKNFWFNTIPSVVTTCNHMELFKYVSIGKGMGATLDEIKPVLPSMSYKYRESYEYDSYKSAKPRFSSATILSWVEDKAPELLEEAYRLLAEHEDKDTNSRPQPVKDDSNFVTLNKAEKMLDEAFKPVIAHHANPESVWHKDILVNISAGAGKSHKMREVVRDLVAKDKENGVFHQYCIFVPDHQLAKDNIDSFQDIAGEVIHLRGKEQFLSKEQLKELDELSKHFKVPRSILFGLYSETRAYDRQFARYEDKGLQERYEEAKYNSFKEGDDFEFTQTQYRRLVNVLINETVQSLLSRAYRAQDPDLLNQDIDDVDGDGKKEDFTIKQPFGFYSKDAWVTQETIEKLLKDADEAIKVLKNSAILEACLNVHTVGPLLAYINKVFAEYATTEENAVISSFITKVTEEITKFLPLRDLFKDDVVVTSVRGRNIIKDPERFERFPEPIVVLPHSYLTIKMSAVKPDYIFIDESPLSTLAHSTPMIFDTKSNHPVDNFIHLFLEEARKQKTFDVTAILEDEQVYEALIEADNFNESTAKNVDTSSEFYNLVVKKPEESSVNDKIWKAANNLLINYRKRQAESKKYEDFIKFLLRQDYSNYPNAIFFRTDKDGLPRTVLFNTIKEPLEIYEGKPTVYLDASANKELLEQVTGKVLSEVTIRIKKDRKKTVHQVYNFNCSKSWLKEEDNLIKINEFTKSLPDCAVIASKQFEEGLEGQHLHFNKLRGNNGLEKKRNIVVVGNNMPSPEGVLEEACKYYCNDVEPLDMNKRDFKTAMIKRDEKYYTATGAFSANNISAFEDTRLQAVLEQINNAEVYQAVERARTIRPGTMDVYILTKTPLPYMQISTLVNFKTLMAQAKTNDSALSGLNKTILFKSLTNKEKNLVKQALPGHLKTGMAYPCTKSGEASKRGTKYITVKSRRKALIKKDIEALLQQKVAKID